MTSSSRTSSEDDEEYPDFERMDEESVVRALSRLRKAEDRQELVWRLGVLSASSASAYALLLDTACSDKSPKVRAEGMATLAQAGSLTAEAFTRVSEHLAKEKAGEVRLAAMDLFGSHLLGREGFEAAIPTVLRAWEATRGDARDHIDMVVRDMTGRFAQEWTKPQRAAMIRGASPRSQASGCIVILCFGLIAPVAYCLIS